MGPALTSAIRKPDVIFLSYDEPNADENFRRLKALAPHAERVHGVKGIFKAYRAAVELARSDGLFVVEGDNWMLEDFVFAAPEGDTAEKVHYWRTLNPVNGMANYFGSVKYFRRNAVRFLESTRGEAAIDLFLVMNERKIWQTDIASETRFNASPFHAWRAGFRECAKTTAGILPATNVVRRQLTFWQTLGADRANGRWCILGARMGAAFGKEHRGSDALRQVNDVEWLRARFETCRDARLDMPVVV